MGVSELLWELRHNPDNESIKMIREELSLYGDNTRLSINQQHYDARWSQYYAQRNQFMSDLDHGVNHNPFGFTNIMTSLLYDISDQTAFLKACANQKYPT
jgi:hypothetical protein